MKKYKVLKPINEFYDKSACAEDNYLKKWFTDEGIAYLIKDGYLEEIQEPEFTQREMKDRCVRFLENHSGYSLNNAIGIYDNWIKGK